MTKLLILCLAGIFSLKANADYRHFLFTPETPIKIEQGVVSFDDDTTSIDLSVSGGPNGDKLGTVQFASCTGSREDETATQDKTGWLILPEQVKVNGVIIKTTILSDNGWYTPGISVSGYVIKIIQKKVSTPLGPCWTVGETLPVDFFWQNAKVRITVPKQKLLPGDYKLTIPYYYGYEENKYIGNSAPYLDVPHKIISMGNTRGDIDLTIHVASKCNFNATQISLSHGSMIGQNADGNQTKPYNLNMRCDPGTSLSVKLVGTQKVSGKTDNYTQCGTGGMCELTFDNGKYDEIMTVDNSKTLSIKSTYHLNDFTKPVAESFEGSGVLQVLIN